MMRCAWLPVLIVALMVSGCGKSSSGKAKPKPKPTSGTPVAPLNNSVGLRKGMRMGLMTVDARMSNKLLVPFNSTDATGMSTSNGGVSEGLIEVAAQTSTSAAPNVSTLGATAGHTILQLEIVEDQAGSMYGKTITKAMSITGIFVKDSKGNMYNPKGYVLNRADKSQQIHLILMSLGGMRSPSQIPYRGMAKQDKIFVVFEIPSKAKVVSFHIGDSTQALQPRN